MKKLAILTSVLALAACGGGSGGSSGGAGIGDIPPVTSGAMPVENVTFGGGLSIQTNDKGQIVALAETWETPEGETNSVTYHIVPETGKISSIEYSDGENEGVLEDGAVQLYGRHVGLKFADFGMMYEKKIAPGYGTDTTWSALLAGNPDKEIQTINGTKAFSGTAVAVIGSDTYTTGENGIVVGGDSDVMITNTDDANLVFNGTTGEYTLVMDFTKSDADKWYKVTFNSASSDKIATFSNPNNATIKDNFALANVSEPVLESNHDSEFHTSTNFYGDNLDATEVISELFIGALEGADDRSLYFDATFGGKVAQ